MLDSRARHRLRKCKLTKQEPMHTKKKPMQVHKARCRLINQLLVNRVKMHGFEIRYILSE